MGDFTFTGAGAEGVRMSSFPMGFLKNLTIDQNQFEQVHWYGRHIHFSLTGSGLNATVVNGQMAGLTGQITDLYGGFSIGAARASVIIDSVSVDGATFYALYAAKDWKGLMAELTAGNDQIVGTGGGDLLSGGDGGDRIFGKEGADRILGGMGDDSLFGYVGSDTLVGGSGADQFMFAAAIGKSVDVIADFTEGQDGIQLWRSFFANIGPTGHLGARFEIGSAATHDATRMIYNAASGDLSYDHDGKGGDAAVVFAHLDTGLAMTGNDFTLVN